MTDDKNVKKSETAEREEKTLAFWNNEKIFEESIEKTKDGEPFVFYDGPPFATGLPHYGHLLAGTIKDAIPRYQTMKGRHVRRQWGWDCHGLPIENLIEAKLGLKNKQDIENYGVEKFNDEACSSVMTYDKEWKDIVPRMGRFIDMENSYKTMDWQYSESIWWSFKTLFDKKYIYKGYKSMHICPRCETTLSNNEVADGYKDIKDISITAKFELVDEVGTFVLAWTTTPWTLPGNVALAVGKKVKYVQVKIEGMDGEYILAKELLEKVVIGSHEVVKEFKGSDLVGKTYKPLFDYYSKDEKLENRENGWKIYAADFVTTEDGTGIVHIAPAFGDDDMNLGKENNLPFVQHVKMNGRFKKEVTDFISLLVKPKDDKENGVDHMSTDILILKHLNEKELVFKKEKYEHSYPHCWRCETPLLNYAANSWFVKVTDLKKKMVKENNKINWVPEAIGRARFGNWIADARDWAISRTRYWGAPFPVWVCGECDTQEVIGGIEEIKEKLKSKNKFFIIRHGEADNNVESVVSSKEDNPHHLTKKGIKQIEDAAEELKKEKIDLILASPFVRTKETAKILSEKLDCAIMFDSRIGEPDAGDMEGRGVDEYLETPTKERFVEPCGGGESLNDVRKRVGEFLYETDAEYDEKNILIVSHDYPLLLLQSVAKGIAVNKILEQKDSMSLGNAQISKIDFAPFPHNRVYETDLHRPYIDEVELPCECGGVMKRITDVFDCWYESGSMPYAQFHYPFENKELFEKNYPANFIAEGLDQTRGWFYSLLVLATGLFGKTSYKNVIVNGLILAENGQKMSKSLNNYPDPMDVVDKYGADALRYYMLSSPVVRAETLSFSEKSVGEVYRKVITRLLNVLSFYEMYADRREKDVKPEDSPNLLDRWVLARLQETLKQVSDGLDTYQLDKSVRPIGEFVDDLSTWYLRRSRTRFKGEDVQDRDYALATTKYVFDVFSRVIAPSMPFVSDYVYEKISGEEKSVHLSDWPEKRDIDKKVLEGMLKTRKIVSQALEQRATAGIKVRQPLAKLQIKDRDFKGQDQYLELIADEVNVKEVEVKTSLKEGIVLDMKLTSELVQEGRFRELVRHIQQRRKKQSLTPNDHVLLEVQTDESGKDLVESFREEIMKTTLLKGIVFREDVEGAEVVVDDLKFIVALQK